MSKIFAALATIQNQFVVRRDNVNKVLNDAKYADYADIRAALDPKLREHGLALSFRPGKMRADGGQFIQALTLVVVHVESGEREEAAGEFGTPEGNRGVNFAQRYGSALTYAMRYMLVGFFGIVTGDDDDARRASRMSEDNGRDGAPAASDTGHWSLLMEGHWAEVAAPEGGCTIGEMPAKQRAALLAKYPTHAGLTAWVADSRFLGTLSELGWGWDDFTAAAGGSWPDRLEHCDSAQVIAAASTAKALLAKGGAK